MDRSRATYEAYDGVKLHLPSGRVVECEALTVQEAVRFLRMLEVSEDLDAREAFETGFVERIGIGDELLADFAQVDVDVGAMTVAEGFRVAQPWLRGALAPETAGGARALAGLFETAADVLGVAPDADAADALEVIRRFSRQFYAMLYGLAQDFWALLAARPKARELVIHRAYVASTFDPREAWTT